MLGAIAITLYVGIFRLVEKYGSAILSGWTIENTLIFVGFSAIFVLTLLISRRMIRKIIGRQRWEMTTMEYITYFYGSIFSASVILTLGLLFLGFLVSDKLK